MKKLLFCLFLLFLGSISDALSQDKLLDRKGNEYLVKVLEITPDSVFYIATTNSGDTTAFTIPKTDVFMITYQNGVKDVFQVENINTETPKEAETPKLSRQQYYYLGRQEARKNFNSSGAYWGTFGATAAPMLVIGPVGGIVTGLAVGFSNPKDENVIASKPEYKKNPDYMQGYNKQAKLKKLGSAAGGLGTVIGIYLVFTAIALNSLN